MNDKSKLNELDEESRASIERARDEATDIGGLMHFMAHQQSLKRYVTEGYVCDFCDHLEAEWGPMVNHLVDEHEGSIDWDSVERQREALKP